MFKLYARVASVQPICLRLIINSIPVLIQPIGIIRKLIQLIALHKIYTSAFSAPDKLSIAVLSVVPAVKKPFYAAIAVFRFRFIFFYNFTGAFTAFLQLYHLRCVLKKNADQLSPKCLAIISQTSSLVSLPLSCRTTVKNPLSASSS